MNEELRARGGRYIAIQQDDTTPEDPAGNFVVYRADTNPLTPVWDKRSFEARGTSPAPPETVDVRPEPPASAVPLPSVGHPPADGGGALRLLRVTDERDGELVPRMYSYWSSCWIGAACAYVFVGHVDNHPRFFQVDRITGAVNRFGSLIHYEGTGEGWYWDVEGWVYLCDGPSLRRCNPFTGEDRVIFDISDTHPGCRLWQAHSSDDGATHSATVERITSDGPYQRVGTVVFWKGRQDFYPAKGVLDESQVTPDGGWLVIKEDDDNRIINLFTRETQTLRQDDGACGHSDCGPGLLVGEDDAHGACVAWNLRRPLTPGNRQELFKTWGMGHVCLRGGRLLLSDATHISLVALDGSGVTPLVEHGMTGSDYDHQVQANLDPTGRVACYLSNQGGDRFDVFLLELP